MRVISCVADIEEGLAALVAADARLAPVCVQAGEVPLRRSTTDFAGLASIIVSQQVSKASADAIFSRLKAMVDPLDAATLLAAGEARLREAGLSGPKQRTLINIAQAVDGGELDLQGLAFMPAGEAIAAMTAIKGIGPWTAEIYLLFCAGHADILPAGDLAMQEAVRAAFAMEKRPADKELRVNEAQWSPWSGVASRLLWSYYATLRGGRDATPA
ncbi:MAG TPA: DNA-3-methyladenine glycosylase 2 family protein [Rhizobiaceae bacterium]|nr:DNA-3-methyladenine glycosylase 2 family protein [Rhizobiaceae bacterium]